MMPQKIVSVIRAALYTFLMVAVRTQSLPPSSVAGRSHIEQTSRDRLFLSRGDLLSRSSSRNGDIFRIRRSDIRDQNEETEVSEGARYIINASPTSQPIMFFHDSSSDSHELRNSMLLIKKRKKKPPHATVFTHASALSLEDPLDSTNSQLSEAATSTHAHHIPFSIKTTSPSPLMYYHNFNIDSTEDQYYPAGNANTENANLGMSGNIWRRTTKMPSMINNHHLGTYVKPRPTLSFPKTSHVTKPETQSSAVVWRLTTTKMPSSGVINNHRPGSKGTQPGKKPPNSGGFSVKRPHTGVKNPAYFSLTSSDKAASQGVRKPVYSSSQTLSTTAPHQAVKKPAYFTFIPSETASHQAVRKPVYSSQTSTTAAPHQAVKQPAYFSHTSLPTVFQKDVEKPEYFSQTASFAAPYEGVKKPTYFSQGSTSKVEKTEYTHAATSASHQRPDSPESSYFTKQLVPSTTHRTHPESFTTSSANIKVTTQRPASIKIKGTPSHMPSTSPQQLKKKPVFQEEEPQKLSEDYTTQVNNHRPLSMMRRRKPLLPSKIHNPSSHVAIVDKVQQTAIDIIGQRLKLPETVRSSWMTVLEAPPDRPTTIKHNRLIVAQKRVDLLPQVTVSPLPHDEVTTTVVVTSQPIVALTTKHVKTTTLKPSIVAQETTKDPEKGTYPVAPVIDPWADIPVPSVPGWAVSSTTRPPSLGSPSGSSFFPGFPYFNYFGSLISPLLNRPLTPSAVNTGMQGIKAMQGFLRNSLMGAMFCFLPSALIAMTMSATQKAELRKIPEINNFMLFCKKCLENLESMQTMDFNRTEPDWVHSL